MTRNAWSESIWPMWIIIWFNEYLKIRFTTLSVLLWSLQYYFISFRGWSNIWKVKTDDGVEEAMKQGFKQQKSGFYRHSMHRRCCLYGSYIIFIMTVITPKATIWNTNNDLTVPKYYFRRKKTGSISLRNAWNNMKKDVIVIFWGLKPCCEVHTDQHFRETCCLHFQDKTHFTVSTLMTEACGFSENMVSTKLCDITSKTIILIFLAHENFIFL